jgi:uncharacterized protein YbcI
MKTAETTRAQQIASAVMAFEKETTGHVPQSVTVVLSNDLLVITLKGVLSQAEKVSAQSPAGAAKVSEYHRELFASAAHTLREQIESIIGVKLSEATEEIDPGTGIVVKVFTTGAVVQVFSLSQTVPADSWSGSDPGLPQQKEQELDHWADDGGEMK